MLMSKQSVSLVSVTPRAEELIAYCARVSGNQDNVEYAALLKYCMTHSHWSVFEQADMTVEIHTTRAIAQQILRHRSFCFQEFSQRYAKVDSAFVPCEARRQDYKNRQNSIDDLPQQDKDWFIFVQQQIWFQATEWYKEALSRGIAKECARMLLPLNVVTKLYMKGNLRSWIHYLQLRTDPSTQLEHREIAEQIRLIFNQQFPTIGGLI